MTMLLNYLKDCEEFIAGDGSILRELLHPAKADLQIHYSLAYAKVKTGQVTKPHKLRTCEVYYILAGKGLMYIDNESFEVTSNCAIYIPPQSTQYIENTGNSDLKFLCIVDPAWRKEDEEVLDR
jgi:mannose-6-phosphate isomerase-like protein (cupin superfamily)